MLNFFLNIIRKCFASGSSIFFSIFNFELYRNYVVVLTKVISVSLLIILTFFSTPLNAIVFKVESPLIVSIFSFLNLTDIVGCYMLLILIFILSILFWVLAAYFKTQQAHKTYMVIISFQTLFIVGLGNSSAWMYKKLYIFTGIASDLSFTNWVFTNPFFTVYYNINPNILINNLIAELRNRNSPILNIISDPLQYNILLDKLTNEGIISANLYLENLINTFITNKDLPNLKVKDTLFTQYYNWIAAHPIIVGCVSIGVVAVLYYFFSISKITSNDVSSINTTSNPVSNINTTLNDSISNTTLNAPAKLKIFVPEDIARYIKAIMKTEISQVCAAFDNELVNTYKNITKNIDPLVFEVLKITEQVKKLREDLDRIVKDFYPIRDSHKDKLDYLLKRIDEIAKKPKK